VREQLAQLFPTGQLEDDLPFQPRPSGNDSAAPPGIRRQRPPVVHLGDFPALHINHAVVLFDARESDKEIEFSVYDPNDSSKPSKLKFDRVARRFYFPSNFYFTGGRVSVYEIYYGSCY
jgi:hypothetical protein